MYIWLHSSTSEFSSELSNSASIVTETVCSTNIVEKIKSSSMSFREKKFYYICCDTTNRIPSQVDCIVHFCNINKEFCLNSIENVKKKYEAVIRKNIPLYVFNNFRNVDQSFSFLTANGQIKYEFGKILDIVNLILLNNDFYHTIVPNNDFYHTVADICIQNNKTEIPLLDKLEKLVRQPLIPVHEMKLNYIAGKIDEINKKLNNGACTELVETFNIPTDLIKAMIEYYMKYGYIVKSNENSITISLF